MAKTLHTPTTNQNVPLSLIQWHENGEPYQHVRRSGPIRLHFPIGAEQLYLKNKNWLSATSSSKLQQQAFGSKWVKQSVPTLGEQELQYNRLQNRINVQGKKRNLVQPAPKKEEQENKPAEETMADCKDLSTTGKVQTDEPHVSDCDRQLSCPSPDYCSSDEDPDRLDTDAIENELASKQLQQHSEKDPDKHQSVERSSAEKIREKCNLTKPVVPTADELNSWTSHPGFFPVSRSSNRDSRQDSRSTNPDRKRPISTSSTGSNSSIRYSATADATNRKRPDPSVAELRNKLIGHLPQVENNPSGPASESSSRSLSLYNIGIWPVSDRGISLPASRSRRYWITDGQNNRWKVQLTDKEWVKIVNASPGDPIFQRLGLGSLLHGSTKNSPYPSRSCTPKLSIDFTTRPSTKGTGYQSSPNAIYPVGNVGRLIQWSSEGIDSRAQTAESSSSRCKTRPYKGDEFLPDRRYSLRPDLKRQPSGASSWSHQTVGSPATRSDILKVSASNLPSSVYNVKSVLLSDSIDASVCPLTSDRVSLGRVPCNSPVSGSDSDSDMASVHATYGETTRNQLSDSDDPNPASHLHEDVKIVGAHESAGNIVVASHTRTPHRQPNQIVVHVPY